MCVAAAMKGTFSKVPGGASAGHVEARVVLTNTSAATCRTFGYLGMQLLGANGQHLPTDVVRQPGPITPLAVAPGQSVSALALFSPSVSGAGDSPTPPCQPVAVNTEITPPNDTHTLVAPGPDSPVCEKGTIQVKPLQAGANAGP